MERLDTVPAVIRPGRWKGRGLLALACAAALVLAGCAQKPGGQAVPSASLPAASQAQQAPVPQAASQPEAEFPEESLHPYLEELISQTASQLIQPGMGEYERAKAAFDYMVEHTVLDQPIGLDLWRVHGGGDQPIPYLQQRALSPLRFGVGMCEDYAAALTLLLRGMGLEAQYVPGLTYSVEGNLVDHAWTVVRIDGVWYHLDSQLEDNISRHGEIRYRYFLKGDATLAGSHRWGRNLVSSGLLSPEQNAQIVEEFPTPACPQDYDPVPPRRPLEEAPAPDLSALHRQAREEVAAWEAENGPLPPMQLNTTPPVFGLEGFGPSDEG